MDTRESLTERRAVFRQRSGGLGPLVELPQASPYPLYTLTAKGGGTGVGCPPLNEHTRHLLGGRAAGGIPDLHEAHRVESAGDQSLAQTERPTDHTLRRPVHEPGRDAPEALRLGQLDDGRDYRVGVLEGDSALPDQGVGELRNGRVSRTWPSPAGALYSPPSCR